MATEREPGSNHKGLHALFSYPLMSAITERRTRRFARWNVGLTDFQKQRMCFRIPLLKGEGGAKRRVRGTEMKEH
jgi:hypothetical protein